MNCTINKDINGVLNTTGDECDNLKRDLELGANCFIALFDCILISIELAHFQNCVGLARIKLSYGL